MNWNPRILLKFLLAVIGRCFLVSPSHWLQGKCARINSSQAASCTHFQCQNRRFRVFEAVTGRIFKNSKQFHGSKLKLWVWFFSSTKNQKIVKTISAWIESTFLLLYDLQKIFFSWHYPFNTKNICSFSFTWFSQFFWTQTITDDNYVRQWQKAVQRFHLKG